MLVNLKTWVYVCYVGKIPSFLVLWHFLGGVALSRSFDLPAQPRPVPLRQPMTTRVLLKKPLRPVAAGAACRSFSKINFPKIRSSKKDDIAKIGKFQYVAAAG